VANGGHDHRISYHAEFSAFLYLRATFQDIAAKQAPNTFRLQVWKCE